MEFTSKKEADAYDTTLEIADQIFEFIDHANFHISEESCESLALFISKNRLQFLKILKKIKTVRKKCI